MAENGGFEAVTFTDEEYDEFFGVGDAEVPPRRRIGRWAQVIAAIAVLAMLATSVTVLVNALRDFASIGEPVEIRERALDRIAESEWGWLANDVVVVAIPEPNVGARVTNNPPDGIITIDRRNWNGGRLDRLVEHELGHLLDFAVWGAAPRAERRNGLETEPWAECAAVASGTRRIDGRNADDRYHCFADEFDAYQDAVGELTEVCRRWEPIECRTVDTLRP